MKHHDALGTYVRKVFMHCGECLGKPLRYFFNFFDQSPRVCRGALLIRRARRAYVCLSCLSISAPEYGGRCSCDGLAEPMILFVCRCQPPSMGGVVQMTGSQSQ